MLRWAASVVGLSLLPVAAIATQPRLAPPLAMLLETGAPLGIESVLAGAEFAAVGERPNLGYVGRPLWVRVDLSDVPRPRREWLVELAQPLLDRVDAYVTTGRSVLATARSGDLRAFDVRPYAHRNVVLPLPDTEAGDLRLYLRIESEGSIALPITLWRADVFQARESTAALLLGLMFGVMASLVLYNGFLYLAVRDPSYLHYVGYLGGATLLLFTLHGFSAQHLWPHLEGAGNAAVPLLLGLTLLAGSGFSRQFLNTAKRQPWLDRALAASGWASLAAMLLGLTASYRWGIQMLMLCGLAQLPLIGWAILVGVRDGFRPALFIGLGFTALMPGALVYALRTFGVLASTPWTDRAFELGVTLEAVLLSFGLADRINTLAREKRVAEAAAAAERERFARRLVERQEQDRRRIAGNLHDSVLQNLGAIGSRLRRLAREPAPSGAELAGLGELARDATRELRGIVDDLHPHQLERLGFAAAARAAVERAFEGTGVEWRVSVAPGVERTLTPQQAVQVYRMLQEGVANVAKHADARRCEVTITDATGEPMLLIEDDGRGVDPASPPGLGRATLDERAALLGARLEFGPRPAGGTRLALTMTRPE
ncbi:MAG: hypothetical protein JNM90_00815 [Burkholderiales bacterium]|nr:hypothetical protein [Burkholderiales bacterium]